MNMNFALSSASSPLTSSLSPEVEKLLVNTTLLLYWGLAIELNWWMKTNSTITFSKNSNNNNISTNSLNEGKKEDERLKLKMKEPSSWGMTTFYQANCQDFYDDIYYHYEFGPTPLFNSIGEKESDEAEKRMKNCLVTNDRSYLLYAKLVQFNWFKKDNSLKNLQMMMKRTKKQRNKTKKHTVNDNLEEDEEMLVNNLDNLLLSPFIAESPAYTSKLREDTKGEELTFNIVTGTYRTDSDVWSPYGRTIRRRKPLSNESMEQLIDKIRFKLHKFASESKVQTKRHPQQHKLIGWFVSHCDTKGRRELYVKELANHLPVDIYGDCGPLNCTRDRSEQCYTLLSQEYLFYLSFENSICHDYVTEKVFTVMEDRWLTNVVPIVYGGANYSKILPSDSYIDATKMQPKQLAQLLLNIVANIINDGEQYLKYFKWRQHYQVITHYTHDYMYCGLCYLVNKFNKQTNKQLNSKKYSKTFKQINDWWFNGMCYNDNYKKKFLYKEYDANMMLMSEYY